jgi:hypothetical protein
MQYFTALLKQFIDGLVGRIQYFCAYEHGFYKDYTAEEHIAMLHSILNDVKATVKIAQVTVEEIRKL